MTPVTPTQRAALRHIAETGGARSSAIAAAIGMTRQAVGLALPKLVDAGYVVRDGMTYTITDYGRQAIVLAPDATHRVSPRYRQH